MNEPMKLFGCDTSERKPEEVHAEIDEIVERGGTITYIEAVVPRWDGPRLRLSTNRLAGGTDELEPGRRACPGRTA